MLDNFAAASSSPLSDDDIFATSQAFTTSGRINVAKRSFALDQKIWVSHVELFYALACHICSLPFDFGQEKRKKTQKFRWLPFKRSIQVLYFHLACWVP